MWSQLQQREVFHLAFLRQWVKGIRPELYALKGGTALRFFFNSIRYSEDMDLDIKGVPVFRLKEMVMKILSAKTLEKTLHPFQIDRVIPPNIQTAKQTETVQRFKVHLITAGGENLFTKIEFSRRTLNLETTVEPVSPIILSNYKQPPLLLCHYPIGEAMKQKIEALANRQQPQVRDLFDLFILSSQNDKTLQAIQKGLSAEKIKLAKETASGFRYQEFQNAVCNYLGEEDRKYYEQKEMWKSIQKRIVEVLSHD